MTVWRGMASACVGAGAVGVFACGVGGDGPGIVLVRDLLPLSFLVLVYSSLMVSIPCYFSERPESAVLQQALVGLALVVLAGATAIGAMVIGAVALGFSPAVWPLCAVPLLLAAALGGTRPLWRRV